MAAYFPPFSLRFPTEDGMQIVNEIWSQYFDGVHRATLDPG